MKTFVILSIILAQSLLSNAAVLKTKRYEIGVRETAVPLYPVPTNYVTAFDTPSPTQGAQRRQDDVSYAPDEPASTVPDTTEPASPPYVPEPVSTVPEVTGDS